MVSSYAATSLASLPLLAVSRIDGTSSPVIVTEMTLAGLGGLMAREPLTAKKSEVTPAPSNKATTMLE